MSAPTRADAEALDAVDPLAALRERFLTGDEPRIYVDGNSLGRQPLAARGHVERRLDEWGRDLVSAWSRWIDVPRAVGDALAEHVVGARPGEVLACDSTTVNLYKLAGAVLALADGDVVVPADEFPTDRYVLEGLVRARGRSLRRLAADPVAGPTAAEVAAACADGAVALVVISHVGYRSGALADMGAITAAARGAGARVLWDLSHSAGSVPVGLADAGAELAVGCTYKYLNGGPGAPAYLYVRADLQDVLASPIQGWFGQRDQFAMGPEYRPAAGIDRFAAGTPSIVAMAAVEAGIEAVAEAGVAAIRRKGEALTELVVALHDASLAPLGFALGTPRDAARRGCHVSLRHPEAWPVCQALVARAAVVPDFRGPDSIRIGLPPLYTRFVDAWDALDRLRRLVERGEQRAFPAVPARVT